MAPEQARGQPAGPAADQFALGIVLAEMLAGGRVAGDPDAITGALPDTLPRALVDAVRRAVDPDAALRWPTIEHFARALRDLDVTRAPAPQRLLPEVRVKGPFAWAARYDALTELAPSIRRADYKLSALEAAGAISTAAARAFRERFGYADFGWAVMGRTDRLGAITDPAAYARAGELVVMLHGGMSTRESWIDVAMHVAQGNGQTLVLVPDICGYGVSQYARRLPRRDHVGAEAALAGVLAWMELLGVRDFPLVLVGHSLSGTTVMTARDEQLGARTWRIAVAPVFPELDWRQRWGLKLIPACAAALSWLPGMKRLLGNLAFVWSRAARAYAPEVRQDMLARFMQIPMPALVRELRAFSLARSATPDQLARCVVVLSENDPVAPIDRTLGALGRIGLPEHQIHRLVAEGHVPHGQAAIHPEWTRRNIIELVAIIDHLLVAAREGSVLPTQVASTLLSDGSSASSAS
jgi:predicted alpha/beta hydrolase family esterase